VVTVTNKLITTLTTVLFIFEFSEYGATIVAYALSAVLLFKLTATFRRLHFNL